MKMLIPLLAIGLVASAFDIQSVLSIKGEIIKEEAIDVDAPAEAITKPWACDIRTWVRAPDLAPGVVHSAEARLAANGSACGDIDGWQVGLRFKERAIIKLKSTTATAFPVRPKWPSLNVSEEAAVDREDIYFAGNFRGPFRQHEIEMEKYNEAIRNASLWEVDGTERLVFDIRQRLPLVDGVSELGFIDTSQGFVVHMPYTNFPPIRANRGGHSIGGDEQASRHQAQTPLITEHSQMVSTETQLEYYHLIHLVNGSILDLPAGRAAFLPLPAPVTAASSKLTGGLLGSEGDVEIGLDSPRVKHDAEEDEIFGIALSRPHPAPDCDAGNIAQFSLSLAQLPQAAVQGRNVTLNVTLTRTGNGSEYPATLHVGHVTECNITWAWRHVTSEDQYQKLVNPSGRGSVIHLDSQAESMLMVKTEDDLEKERERRSQRGMRRPDPFDMLGLMPGFAKHPFNKTEEAKDAYNFQLELPIRYNDFPSFETTFETFRSALRFRLYTRFKCVDDEAYKAAVSSHDPHALSQADSLARDNIWTEYALPISKKSTRDCRLDTSYRREPHMATLPLDAVTSSAAELLDPVMHYCHNGAFGPVLSRQITDKIVFPALNQETRLEREDELRRSRYGFEEKLNRRWAIQGNSGGGWMHAASLWQREQRREKDAQVKPIEGSTAASGLADEGQTWCVGQD